MSEPLGAGDICRSASQTTSNVATASTSREKFKDVATFGNCLQRRNLAPTSHEMKRTIESVRSRRTTPVVISGSDSSEVAHHNDSNCSRTDRSPAATIFTSLVGLIKVHPFSTNMSA